MEKWFKYGLAFLLVLILAGLGSFWSGKIQQSVLEYETAYSLSRERVASRKPVTPPLSERVVWVVIDKLDEDSFLGMPFLEALRTEGAYMQLRSAQPRTARPTYAVLSSGAWPEINGVIHSDYEKRMPADNLFRRVMEADLTSLAVADNRWSELNGNYFAKSSFYHESIGNDPTRDQRIFREALDALQNYQGNLVLIHLPDTGETLSTDKYLQGLVEELDFSQDTLLVTGGEGGTALVPLIAAGNKVSPGQYGLADQTDVTATLAALLGITPPTEAQGRALWEMLSVPGQIRAPLESARAQNLLEMASSYTAQISYASLARKDLSEAALLLDEAARYSRACVYESAFQKARQATKILVELMNDIRADKIWRGRWLRLPLVALILAALSLAVIKLTHRQQVLLLAGALVYVAIFAILNQVLPSVISAILAALLGIAIVWPLRQISRKYTILPAQSVDYPEIAFEYTMPVLGIYFWLTAITLAGFLCDGFSIGWYLPGPRLTSLTLTTLQQMVILAPAPLIALAIPYWDKPPKMQPLPANGELTLEE